MAMSTRTKLGTPNVSLIKPCIQSYNEADIESKDKLCNEEEILVATFCCAAIWMVCVHFLVGSVLSFVDFRVVIGKYSSTGSHHTK